MNVIILGYITVNGSIKLRKFEQIYCNTCCFNIIFFFFFRVFGMIEILVKLKSFLVDRETCFDRRKMISLFYFRKLFSPLTLLLNLHTNLLVHAQPRGVQAIAISGY